MAEVQPNYYSILTAEVRYDSRLKNHADEKVLFSEITALSNKYGYCNASNKYFAELYDRSTTTISRWINHLKDLGYLTVLMDYEGNQIKQRRIYAKTASKIRNESERGMVADDNTPSHECGEGTITDDKGGILTGDKDNITSINTTSNNSHDDDAPVESLLKLYSQEIGVLGPTAKQFVLGSVNDFVQQGTTEQESCEIVSHAINLMVENSAKSWKYVQAILKNWLDNNLFTLDNIKASQQKREQKQTRKYRPQKPKEAATNWDQVKANKSDQNSIDLQARLARIRGEKA